VKPLLLLFSGFVGIAGSVMLTGTHPYMLVSGLLIVLLSVARAIQDEWQRRVRRTALKARLGAFVGREWA
jgi:hypothetical protein